MKIFIDGENLRHGLADVLVNAGLISTSRDLRSYPFKNLLIDVLGRDDLEIFYYASRIKLPKGYQPTEHIIQRAVEINEFNRRWIAHLTEQNIEHIKAGYLKVKSTEPCPKCGQISEVLQEKGVDVRLAIDLVGASDESKGEVGLLSSDSDLIPAVDRVNRSGGKVVYICFADSVNRAMSASASETVAIATSKVVQLYEDNNNGRNSGN